MRSSVVLLLLLLQGAVNYAQYISPGAKVVIQTRPYGLKQTKLTERSPVQTLSVRIPQTKHTGRPQNNRVGVRPSNSVHTLPARLSQTRPANRLQEPVRRPQNSQIGYAVKRPTNYQVLPYKVSKPTNFQVLPGRFRLTRPKTHLQTRPSQRYPKDTKTSNNYRALEIPNECLNSCVYQSPKVVGICCSRHNQCCYQGYF